jgi:hypothetical protein
MYDRKFGNKLDMWEYERVVVTWERDNKESVTNTGAATFSPTSALAVKSLLISTILSLVQC